MNGLKYFLLHLKDCMKEGLQEFTASVTSKKSRNVYKSCPKMISLEKIKKLTPVPKLPKNVWDLGKIIVAKAFGKLPKVQ